MSEGTEYAIQPDDLRSDAVLWRSAGTSVDQAGDLGGDAADLPNDAFMMAGIAVAAGYRALASQLLDRLADGSGQLHGLAVALEEIAKEFELHEQQSEEAIAELLEEVELGG